MVDLTTLKAINVQNPIKHMALVYGRKYAHASLASNLFANPAYPRIVSV
jgi:hypothetical protein